MRYFIDKDGEKVEVFSIKVCHDLQNITCVDKNLKRYIVPLGSIMEEDDPEPDPDGLITFIDDTFDYGTEPLPITPEAQKIFDKWEKIHNPQKKKKKRRK